MDGAVAALGTSGRKRAITRSGASEESWSAIDKSRQQATSPYAQADELEVDEKADDDHGGTMMMSDWPSKSSLGQADSLDRYRQSDSDDPAEEPNAGSARQFEFQAQRYAVEEAEPAESMREIQSLRLVLRLAVTNPMKRIPLKTT